MTCYINSVLQVLYACSGSYFHSKEKNWKSKLGKYISRLFQNKVNENATDNRYLEDAIDEIRSQCHKVIGDQQDAAVKIRLVSINLKSLVEELFQAFTDPDDRKSLVENFAMQTTLINSCPHCEPGKEVPRNNSSFIILVTGAGRSFSYSLSFQENLTLNEKLKKRMNFEADCGKCGKKFMKEIKYKTYPKYLFIKTDAINFKETVQQTDVDVCGQRYLNRIL